MVYSVYFIFLLSTREYLFSSIFFKRANIRHKVITELVRDGTWVFLVEALCDPETLCFIQIQKRQVS